MFGADKRLYTDTIVGVEFATKNINIVSVHNIKLLCQVYLITKYIG